MNTYTFGEDTLYTQEGFIWTATYPEKFIYGHDTPAWVFRLGQDTRAEICRLGWQSLKGKWMFDKGIWWNGETGRKMEGGFFSDLREVEVTPQKAQASRIIEVWAGYKTIYVRNYVGSELIFVGGSSSLADAVNLGLENFGLVGDILIGTSEEEIARTCRLRGVSVTVSEVMG